MRSWNAGRARVTTAGVGELESGPDGGLHRETTCKHRGMSAAGNGRDEVPVPIQMLGGDESGLTDLRTWKGQEVRRRKM
jgi:hypothetical protein